jgi:hypothetical protein
MKKYLLICFLLLSCVGLSQQLNQYKYALVPSKFSFLNAVDEHRLNTLTKLFMEKYQFITYFDTDVLPEEFAHDNCGKVYVDVVSNSTIFMTKLKIVLKDCKNNILFTSEEGTSREKQYAVAYNQALRSAFDKFSVLKSHTYVSKDKIVENNTTDSNVGETTSEILDSKLSVVTTENGFDLYNIESKLVLSAKKTSVKNVFIAIAGAERGVLQKNSEGVWHFEYYREGSKKLISESLLFTL